MKTLLVHIGTLIEELKLVHVFPLNNENRVHKSVLQNESLMSLMVQFLPEHIRAKRMNNLNRFRALNRIVDQNLMN